MKNRLVITTAVIGLVLLYGTYSAYAQGFSSILKKLDEVEVRLDKLEVSQKSDIDNLQKQFSEIKPGEDVTVLNSSIADIQSRVAGLETTVTTHTENLEQIKTDIDQTDEQVEVENLASDLRGLVAELRETIGNAPESGSNPGPETPALSISGFVDVSYYYDGNSGGNTFGLDQVETDVEKSIGEIGSIRADLEWFNDGAGGFALEVEQGYVIFSPGVLNSWSLTFGKFNAPIGFELLDAPDMFQYSHALVFDYGLPTNLTGGMLTGGFGKGFDLSVYLCNGWDQNVDVNTGKTFGGRIGYTFGELGVIGLSAIRGAESGPEGDILNVFDVDLTATPTEKLTLGGEFNHGSEDTGGTTAAWTGLLLMTHYDFKEYYGLTFRYDFFDDSDATRLGSGIAEKRQALTISPTFSLGEGMGALVELRYDFSDEEVFTDKDGVSAKSAAGVAFEMTYIF